MNDDDLLRDFLLEAFPNPERKGCPDVKTIKALAEDRLPPGHPAGPHIGSCSECYAEYRNYRLDWKETSEKEAVDEAGSPSHFVMPLAPTSTIPTERTAPLSVPAVASRVVSTQSSKPYKGFAFAALLLVLIGGGILAFRTSTTHLPATTDSLLADAKPVDVRVDLSNAVTARGVDDALTPVQEVTLPASIVRLSVTLPHFSQTGKYVLLVSMDRDGKNRVAEGLGNAAQNGDDVSLQSTLDLRKAKPGAYFLATVRGSDNGTYYYPLRVK